MTNTWKTTPILDRVKQVIKHAKEQVGMWYFNEIPQDEKEILIKILQEGKDDDAAVKIFYTIRNDPSSKSFTDNDKQELKNIILNTTNPDIAGEALLNIRNAFTEEEQNQLRHKAVLTQNAFAAYSLYKHEWKFLDQHKDIKSSLRKIIVGTEDPKCAFYFLQNQEEDLLSPKESINSLQYTPQDLEYFKNVIIEGKDPESSYKLLTTKHAKEWADAHDTYYYEPHVVIDLSPSEQSLLKKSIIESRNPYWAYDTFCNTENLSTGERLVLKGIFMQTKEASLACSALCNTDFISHLTSKERADLIQLAMQVKSKYDAQQLLTYVYDLTSEQRDYLEHLPDDTLENWKE